MFVRRKSKRALVSAELRSQGSESRNRPRLWEIPDERRNSLLEVVCRLLVKLKHDALEEEFLFIRKSGGVKATDSEEEFQVLEGVVQDYFESKQEGEQAAKAVLNKNGVHVWANVVKEILKHQSPQKLIAPSVAADILELPDIGPHSVDRLRTILEDMPHSRYCVLKDLCLVLKGCSTPNEKLGFVFGATLLLPEEDKEFVKVGADKLLKQAESCTAAMEVLITQADKIFQTLSSPPMLTGKQFKADTMKSSEVQANSVCSVKALYDFCPSEVDELELVAGEWVEVIEKVDADWLRGRHVSQSGTQVEGIFPQNYCDMSTFRYDLFSNKSLGLSQDGSHTDNAVDPSYERVIALYPYEAREGVEISLEEDEILDLLDSTDDDWWKGRSSQGEIGLFPKSYVELLSVHLGKVEGLQDKQSSEALGSENENEASIEEETKEEASMDLVHPSQSPIRHETTQDLEATGKDGIHEEAVKTAETPIRKKPVIPHQPRKSSPRTPRPRIPPPPNPRVAQRISGNDSVGTEHTAIPTGQVRREMPSKSTEDLRHNDNKTSSKLAVAGLNRSSPIANIRIDTTPRRSLLHGRHSNIDRSAIPTNRPAPIVRKPLTNRVQLRSETQYGSPSLVRTQDAAKWDVDQSRFTLCYEWFKKLAVTNAKGEYFVGGKSAAEFLLKSGLDRGVVAKILELADIDFDKQFDRDEFIIAHHVAINVKSGMPLPDKLPTCLIPASKRRIRRSINNC